MGAEMKEIRFSPEKAVEYLLFISTKLKSPTIHEVLKIRYFADKLHLSRYGFLASGDAYVAMRYGPVPSNTYHLLQAARGDERGYINPLFLECVSGALEVYDQYNIHPLRNPALEFISPSDIECMEEAIEQFGGLEFVKRTDMSHDAAWKAAWGKARSIRANVYDITLKDIAGALENKEEVLDHLKDG
jgi:hypothetical protein